MKKKITIVRWPHAIFLSIMLSAQGCGDLHNSATPIDVDAVHDFVTEHKDAVILDVRTPAEYEESQITGSVNVSMQDKSFEELLIKLDPTKRYIVHCSDNHYVGRSNYALKAMQKLGFEHLYGLKGGYSAWKDAKLPLTETTIN